MNTLMVRLVKLTHYTINQLAEMVEAWEHPHKIPSVKPTTNAMGAMARALDKQITDECILLDYLENYRLENPQVLKECQARLDSARSQFVEFQETYRNMLEDIRLVPELLLPGQNEQGRSTGAVKNNSINNNHL